MPKADPVARLAPLIALDTRNPGGDEPALAAHLRDELARFSPDDLEVTTVAKDGGRGAGASVLARWGAPRLLLNAHLDTVPIAAGWSDDPWRARVRDGAVVGLGAADIKGAIAALLAALDGGACPRDTAILFSGDEEHGNACVRSFLESGAARGIERAIVCEPTGLRVGTRHRGVLAFEVAAEGPGGHSSRADMLPAPLAALARVGAALDDWARARRDQGPPGFPGMCVNVAKLDGGVAFNVIPTRAALTFSLRPPPGADLEALTAELGALIARIAPDSTVRREVRSPPFATRAPDAFRSWFGSALDAPLQLGYWTEAALLSAAGLDAVVFGPGRVEQAHAPDEWVEIAELEGARECFSRVLAHAR